MSERMDLYLKCKAEGTIPPRRLIPYTNWKRDCRTKANFPSAWLAEYPEEYIKRFNKLNHLKEI